MIRSLRRLRLLPVVLLATVSLFALKTIGLLVSGHYALTEARNAEMSDITGSIAETPARVPAKAVKRSWAQEMFNFPDVTGAIAESPPKAAAPGKAERTGDKGEQPRGGGGWTPVPLDGGRQQSPAEVAILERLQERRNELDARSNELEMRENLIKAAEKRLEARLAELKDLEARVRNAAQQRDEDEAARFKNVVTMYESMKPKEAAKIFDRLDIKILVEVATHINPRRMSDILAQMSPEAAERLTSELASRSGKDKPAELPKIEGKPKSD
jgi:flagellar motility protein MotE (MotC chaperone)